MSDHANVSEAVVRPANPPWPKPVSVPGAAQRGPLPRSVSGRSRNWDGAGHQVALWADEFAAVVSCPAGVLAAWRRGRRSRATVACKIHRGSGLRARCICWPAFLVRRCSALPPVAASPPHWKGTASFPLFASVELCVWEAPWRAHPSTVTGSNAPFWTGHTPAQVNGGISWRLADCDRIGQQITASRDPAWVRESAPKTVHQPRRTLTGLVHARDGDDNSLVRRAQPMAPLCGW